MTACIILVSPITGKIMDKIDAGLPLLASFICAFCSIICMLFLGTHIVPTLLCLSLILWGIAVGLNTPSTIHTALEKIEPKYTATAMGVFFTAVMSGAVVGVALAGNCIHFVSKHFLLVSLSGVGKNIPLSVLRKLQLIASGTITFQTAGLSSKNYHSVVSRAFVEAFHVEL